MAVRASGLSLAALALLACGVDEQVNPAPRAEAYAGTLSVDIHGAAEVAIAPRGGDAIDVSVTLRDTDAGGLFALPVTIAGEGTREAFPEAGRVLYVAKVRLPPTAGGACGAEAVSVAVALGRYGDDARVQGGVSAYCGDAFHGVPARIFRLTGELPPR